MKSTLFSAIALVAFTLASTVSASSSHHADFARRRHHARKASTAEVSAAEKLNKASGGTPASMFEADAHLPATSLAAAALKLKSAATSYPVSAGSKTISKIYKDWYNGKNGSAIVFTADMDVDCDGIDYKCSKNPDGQSETNTGALAAYEVPYIVIPQKYVDTVSKDLPGNNVVAVICGGKMYYGIFGDTNGDSPEVIGEASWRFAQTCFGDSINGNNGHAQADVTYIVFTGKDAVLPSSALTENYVTSFTTLQTMGNKFVAALAANIGLHDASGSGITVPTESSAKASGTSTKKGSSSAKETATATSTKTASEKKATATKAASDIANGSSGGACTGTGKRDVEEEEYEDEEYEDVEIYEAAL